MEIQTKEVKNGTEIRVYTDKKVALLVRSNGSERIYLPSVSEDDSTYYNESPNGLARTSEGYMVTHQGEIEDLEVLH